MDFIDHIEDLKKAEMGRIKNTFERVRADSSSSNESNSCKEEKNNEHEEEVTDWFEELWPRESQRELKFQVNSNQITIYQDVKGQLFKPLLANTVWEAGWFLNCYFQEKTVFPENYFVGKSVLELGAGTGVVGMTLALLGAEVTLTDLEEALPILQYNVDQNFSGDKEEELAAQGIAVPEVEELEWGQPLSEVIARQDWDFVVGADIVYNATHFEALARTLEQVCSNQTKCYFSHLKRNVEKSFFQLLNTNFDITPLQCDDFEFSKEIHNAEGTIGRVKTLLIMKKGDFISEEKKL